MSSATPPDDKGSVPSVEGKTSETLPASSTFSADTLDPARVRSLSDVKIRLTKSRSEFYSGPIPPAKMLRDLDKVYPGASRAIFEDFQSQADHRREIESLVIRSRIKLAERGQFLGAGLGAMGIVGSLIAIGLGQGQWGTIFGASCLVSLVSIFVLGRESQKQERMTKAKLGEQIKRSEPIEKIESPTPPDEEKSTS